jgi:predicted RNA-binding Zn ribbon-like protein
VTTSTTPVGEPLPVDLMNTVAAAQHGTHDAIRDQHATAAWIGAISDRLRSDAGDALDPAELDETAVGTIAPQLRELRDALRCLAAEATNDPRPPVAPTIPTRQTAIDTVNALTRMWPELAWPAGETPTRAFRTDGTPAQLIVSLIAHQAVELFTSAQRDQLRACLAPGCLWYFLKQHPRQEWCSAACGNRARVARHYQRHRSGNHPANTAPHSRP